MINLRALNRSDIDQTLKWHNSDDIVKNYLGHPFPINKEMEELWYDNILTSNLPTTVFGIEHQNDQLLIGITVLKNINLINRSGEMAIYIGEKEYKGKGLSKIATRKTLQFGFKQLNLNRISLKVLEHNNVAQSLYEKIGFHKEGELRQSIFKDGTYLNECVYSILKSEFQDEL